MRSEILAGEAKLPDGTDQALSMFASTGHRFVLLRGLFLQDLHVLAPEIEEFMFSYLVEMQDVDEIMCLFLQRKNPGSACHPLLQSESSNRQL